jgi:hypothetical protein
MPNVTKAIDQELAQLQEAYNQLMAADILKQAEKRLALRAWIRAEQEAKREEYKSSLAEESLGGFMGSRVAL